MIFYQKSFAQGLSFSSFAALSGNSPQGGRGTSANEGEIPSQRVFHLFQALVPDAVLDKLQSAQALHFFSAEEVATTKGGTCKGHTADGALIGDNIFTV